MAYLDKLGVPLVESERIVGDVIDDACAKFANADPLRSPLDVTAAEDEDDDGSRVAIHASAPLVGKQNWKGRRGQ